MSKYFDLKFHRSIHIHREKPLTEKETILHFSDVKDIHDWLEVTVYDEDKDHKYEFLGKVKIPLLKIRNSERRWYSLKDKTLRKPAKGDHPQILLEMFFVYNKVIFKLDNAQIQV